MRVCKIVLTGGPSSGKTSVMDALAKRSREITLVPEVASIAIKGGFPIPQSEKQVKVFQQLMHPLQHRAEEMFLLQNPQAPLMILDRGSLDNYGYWPGDTNNFFKETGLDLETELAAYDGVIYFQMPPEKFFGQQDHPTRFHNYTQSKAIGERQREIWSLHSNFIEIPAMDSLAEKIQMAFAAIDKISEGRLARAK